VARGERIGLVRFGSRVDVWLPIEAEIVVNLGDTVHGGASIVARMSEALNVRAAGNDKPPKQAKAKMREDQSS
jgi:phosphatidylserine decarboxylase